MKIRKNLSGAKRTAFQDEIMLKQRRVTPEAKSIRRQSIRRQKEYGKWYPVGAGEVGGRYKGGFVAEMDMKNARARVVKKMPSKEKLSSFAKSIGLKKGRYFCRKCENQTHNVNWEGKCKSCSAS